MMDERGKSDRPVLPMKSSNKAGPPVAERMEGRGLTEGNPRQQNTSRTPSRSDAPSALERIRQAAMEDKEVRFTALFHHMYALETLRMAYLSLKEKLHLVWTVRRGGTTEKILRITSMISPIG